MILLLISTYSIEGVANRFRSPEYARAVALREYLYFTNIALLYTIFSVFVGYLSTYSKNIALLYSFSVVTAFILEIIVTLTFWALYLVDPSLVKNKSDLAGFNGPSITREIPKHALPALILLMEQYGLEIEKHWSHRAFFIGFSLSYYLISEVYTKRAGLYLYPFFKYFSVLQRFMFFCSIALLTLFVYEIFMIIKKRLSAIKRKIKEKRKGSRRQAR